MIQQINLYQDEFRIVPNWARLTLLAGIAFVILVLLGSSIYQSSVISNLEAELKNNNNILKGLEVSYDALEKANKSRAIDMNLVEQVEKAKRSNEGKIRAKNYLSGDGAGNITGFSSLLEGLGRQRDEIEELWLKKIKFSNGGFDMRLVGSNYRPGLLPDFIQALNDENLYRDREFRQIKITQSTEDKKTVDFVLATRNKDDKEEGEANMADKAVFMARLKRFNEDKVAR